MKTYVLYHGDCTDGFASAFVASLVLGEDLDTKYLPIQYPNFKTAKQLFQLIPEKDLEGSTLYILDFSLSYELIKTFDNLNATVTWLDHHKTSFKEMEKDPFLTYDKSEPTTLLKITRGNDRFAFNVLLDRSKSGALLAWEHFFPHAKFVPEFIQLIDDRDRWVWQFGDLSKQFYAYMQSLLPWSFSQWHKEFLREYLQPFGSKKILVDAKVFLHGESLVRMSDALVAQAVATARPIRLHAVYGDGLTEVLPPPWIPIEGLPGYYQSAPGLVVNSSCFQSEIGAALAKESGTFGLVWSTSNADKARCSLRSSGDYDVEILAKRFAGGGHPNAAGFSIFPTTILNWIE